MEKEPILRPSEATDLPRLSALSAAARIRYRTLPRFAFVADAPPMALERFHSGRTIVACCVNDPSPLGFVLMRPLDGALYLDNISVAPGASGLGIGAALLAAVETHRITLRLPAITLTTFRDPNWNGPWFRRHGFAPIPEADIGHGLRTVLDRQSMTLDPTMREALWREGAEAAHAP